jgi:hypothetical protein
MRTLALALLALLLVPVTAAAKELHAPVRVLWNSLPDDIQAGGVWDARLSVLQGPGGLYSGKARPVMVVTELATGAERRVPMVVDVPPNTFRATVAFPRAGFYDVDVAGFDPGDRSVTENGPAARVEPAPPPAATGSDGGGAPWPWALLAAAAAALAALLGALRARRSATSPSPSARS